MIKKLWSRCQLEWDVHPLQVVGAIVLIPAFIIAVMAARADSVKLAYMSWALLALVGAIDLYIIRLARILRIGTVVTVTRWIRALLPEGADNIVMIGFIVLVWWLTGPLFALFYMHGFLNDHFNEYK